MNSNIDKCSTNRFAKILVSGYGENGNNSMVVKTNITFGKSYAEFTKCLEAVIRLNPMMPKLIVDSVICKTSDKVQLQLDDLTFKDAKEDILKSSDNIILQVVIIYQFILF
jgi:hypothetical protein